MKPAPERLSIDFQPVVDQIVAQLRNGDAKPAKRAFRAAEVAEILSISEREVRDLVVAGELDSIRLGRIRLIPSSAIDAFITRKLAERNHDEAE